jgi:hypothetical protein
MSPAELISRHREKGGKEHAMRRQPPLFQLVIAVLALMFSLGASSAAIACARSMVDSTTAVWTKSDCPEMQKAHDYVIVCGLTCAVVVPEGALSQTVTGVNLAPSIMTKVSLVSRHLRPDYPPPRLAW